MHIVSPNIFNRVIHVYGNFYERISLLPSEKCARDVLDETKVHDQIKVLTETCSQHSLCLRGKTILEIGSGFGIFVCVTRRDYGTITFGIEPWEKCNDDSFLISRDVVKEYGYDPSIIYNAKGESLPFTDETFDIVYSTNVLEHTEDPLRVLKEGIRVLKPGGYLQFVFPNYGSFFEGHYAIPWIPYINTRFGRLWVRTWRRDPSFLQSLKFINYFQIKKWLQAEPNISVLSFGEETFRKRMKTMDFHEFAGLGKIKKWVRYQNILKLSKIITPILILLKSFSPIILTLKKNPQ